MQVGQRGSHLGMTDHPLERLTIITSSTRSTGGKLVASLAAIGIAASVATLGSWASFTSSTSASHEASSGTVTASLGTAGSAQNRLTVAAGTLAAGDTVQRVVTLENGGTLPWATAALTTAATTSSLLDTNTTHGLQLVVDSCSVPWSESGAAPAYTYSCSGATNQLIASRAVIGSALDLGSLGALDVGGRDHLRVMLELPGTAGNSFQGLTSTIEFSFVATQRTATAR